MSGIELCVVFIDLYKVLDNISHKRNPNITVKFGCPDRVIAAARHKPRMECFTRVQIESSFVYNCPVTNVERSETRPCRQIPRYVF